MSPFEWFRNFENGPVDVILLKNERFSTTWFQKNTKVEWCGHRNQLTSARISSAMTGLDLSTSTLHVPRHVSKCTLYTPRCGILKLGSAKRKEVIETSSWNENTLTNESCHTYGLQVKALQHTVATHRSTRRMRHVTHILYRSSEKEQNHEVCKASQLQHTGAHCNTVQLTSTHCNTHTHSQILSKGRRERLANCNTLQHTATYCNTLQHNATHTLIHRYCLKVVEKG